MGRTDHPAEEPVLQWICREWWLVLITLGIGLDWLPSVLSSPESPKLAQLSGTKLMVLPGLAIAFLARPGWLLTPHPIGVIYMATLLIGGGLGWYVGTVELWRLIAIGVNGLLLMYFLSLRSLCTIRRVLLLSFALSALIPLVQWMTKLGIIAAGNVEKGPDFERVFSIFDSTTVGFSPLMIAGCLGGLAFLPAKARLTGRQIILGVLLILFGLTGALLAAQRSGVLAYAASLGTAAVLFAIGSRKRLTLGLKLALIMAVAAWGASFYFTDLIKSLQARVTDEQALGDAMDLRLGGIRTFLEDLKNPLEIVPKGHVSLFDRTGVEPHLLLSEAYYEGGPLFLLAIILLLGRFAWACVQLVRARDPRAVTIGHCLVGFSAGAAIQLTLQTALVLRFLPVVLGVGIAAHRVVMRDMATERRARERGLSRSGPVEVGPDIE